MSQPSHEFQQPTKLHAMSTEAEGKALYEGARKDLVNALMKRKDIDKQLAALESQIYTFEGNYLTETTNSGGNIIQGFENYLKHPNAANRKKYEITDGDRIFSNSSSTYGKAINGDADRSADDAGAGSHVTVAVPAARQGSEARSIDSRRDRDSKQKKRPNNQRDDEGTPPLPGTTRKKRPRMASED
ncbi:histone acetyltransferase subunit NuA4 [Rhizoctonia solani]|uniref:Chromatin modification-related protein EAF6 n=1 Tax=Rhizoctonia solani TaxID=456999 RepID=A0A8H8NXV9_9AGAM|nr:histone acetyltransferase subunit NuA4 [Rhizoctonia solani]QRW20333.1 histone acetyltransferase subunit NuA4 [Rhizoctonia solani]